MHWCHSCCACVNALCVGAASWWSCCALDPRPWLEQPQRATACRTPSWTIWWQGALQSCPCCRPSLQALRYGGPLLHAEAKGRAGAGQMQWSQQPWHTLHAAGIAAADVLAAGLRAACHTWLALLHARGHAQARTARETGEYDHLIELVMQASSRLATADQLAPLITEATQALQARQPQPLTDYGRGKRTRAQLQAQPAQLQLHTAAAKAAQHPRAKPVPRAAAAGPELQDPQQSRRAQLLEARHQAAAQQLPEAQPAAKPAAGQPAAGRKRTRAADESAGKRTRRAPLSQPGEATGMVQLDTASTGLALTSRHIPIHVPAPAAALQPFSPRLPQMAAHIPLAFTARPKISSASQLGTAAAQAPLSFQERAQDLPVGGSAPSSGAEPCRALPDPASHGSLQQHVRDSKAAVQSLAGYPGTTASPGKAVALAGLPAGASACSAACSTRAHWACRLWRHGTGSSQCS